jgi:hypothetical protein
LSVFPIFYRTLAEALNCPATVQKYKIMRLRRVFSAGALLGGTSNVGKRSSKAGLNPALAICCGRGDKKPGGENTGGLFLQ